MSLLSRFLEPAVPTRGSRGASRAAASIGNLDALAGLLRSTSYGRLTGTNFDSFERYLIDNPIVFGAFLQRLNMLKQARFTFQRIEAGRPGELFGTPALDILDRPWPGGTTDDLFKAIELDVTRAGIAVIRRSGNRLDVLDPHKISSVTELVSDRPDAPPFLERLVAWVYVPTLGGEPIVFHVDDRELATYIPIPDPESRHAGMTWIRPARLDVAGDDMLTRHRLAYFTNAASPNLVVKSPKPLTDDQFSKLTEQFSERHEGLDNAYRTLLLEGGADVEAIGSDMSGAKFVEVQDAVENRIGVASGVPAPLIGVKVGQSPTYNNFRTARQHFADSWARPSWRDIAGSLAPLIDVPAKSRLWYDDRDIPALQQDADDAAGIRSKDASTIRTLVDGGFTPESAITAVNADDLSRLEHSGLMSVQLQKPITSTEEVAE